MELKNYVAQWAGEVLPGATCYLYQAGTETLASGLQDAAGAALTNPFQAASDGLVQFAAPNGVYDLRVMSGGRDSRMRVQCLDVAEQLAAAQGEADRATNEANRAVVEADRAGSDAARAEAARDAAMANGKTFQDTAAGLAAVADGEYFSVPSAESSEHLILYRRSGASAVEIKRYPSALAVDEIGIQHQYEQVSELSFAVVDETGRRTWLEADMAGHPTDRAVSLVGAKLTAANSPSLVEQATVASVEAAVAEAGIGDINSELNELGFVVVDESGRRTELEIGLDGKLTDRVIKSISARIGAIPSIPDFPVDAWACWGDSLTGGGWPETLASLLAKEVYNGGWGGQITSQIAARQGGVPARVTVSSDTIPASGAVSVTSILNNPLSDGGSRTGYLAGVLGTLAMSGVTLTFTRSNAGVPVLCPAGTYFTPTHGSSYRDRHVAIWVGRNGFKVTPPGQIVASIRAMIDYLTPRVKRVIVMSIPPWEGEEFGTTVRVNQLDPCNAAIASAFPEFWLDIAAWVRTEAAATAAGIIFTTNDYTDIANGLSPRSLRSDAGHFNAQGNTAIATRVHQEIQKRGWM